jgi:hypothetical protein
MGGAGLALAGCATSGASTPAPMILAQEPAHGPAPVATVAAPLTPPPLDPSGRVRPELMQRAMQALDVHAHRLPNRDRMYLVDFQRFSGEERFFEVDLIRGEVTGFRTSHGRGSDPQHSGYARDFSDVRDSHMSSLGAFATAGPNWGSQQGPNVLLDGLEYTNVSARERAIIVHGADYAEPAFLAREGKLGRSYGCFSTSHADLQTLRERMGEGRLLFAWT